MLDFENLPDLPEGALAKADRPSRTRLTKLTRKDTLLPEDLHYEVKTILYGRYGTNTVNVVDTMEAVVELRS